MNSVSTIEVKDINSVARYAAQYVNGEEVTLITKDGTKYYTDGKGGYFQLSASKNEEIPEEPTQSPFIDKLKILAENVDVLKLFSKDESGNLLFDGQKVSGNSGESTQTEVTAEQFNTLKDQVTATNNTLTTVQGDVTAIQSNATSMQKEITTAKEQIAAVETTANAAATKENLEEVKTDVANAKSDISTAKADISGAKENIENIKTDVTKLKSHVHKNAEGDNTGEIVYQ